MKRRLWLTTAMAFVAASMPISASAQTAAPVDPAKQVATMRRGVNILGYDPVWQDPAKARFQPRLMQVIHDGGFSTIRINLQAFAHMDAKGRLADQWLATLDRYVAAALKAKLTIIIDEHDFVVCGDNPGACRPRLTAFWEQVSERFKDAPSNVVFEILNEPNKLMNDQWNDTLALSLAIIRRTNPTRNVIIGPAFWNNRTWLDRLKLPEEDRHLIVTVHYYEPMAFTHQGAPWSPENAKLGIAWGSDTDRATLASAFDGVQRWSKAHDRPILLGEFGAYDKADIASRVAYTAAAARAAEARGWAWAYWQFDGDFIVYDILRDRWFAPIHNALIP